VSNFLCSYRSVTWVWEWVVVFNEHIHYEQHIVLLMYFIIAWCNQLYVVNLERNYLICVLYKIIPLSYSCTVKASLEQPNLSFSLLWINLAFLNSIQHIHVLVYLGIIILQICTLYKKHLIDDVSCSCMYLFILFYIILTDSGIITFKRAN
jgi:hypothetical protein